MLHKLTINFTWWVNREDPAGINVFSGGFLGLDNIAPFDRSKLPPGWRLQQSDGTAWMAFYALSLLELALTLAGHDDSYEDLATKFFEHFAYIAIAMDDQGLWDEEDGFYYDVLHGPDGPPDAVRVRSMVGLIPLFAVTTLEAELLARLPAFRARMEWFERHRAALRVGVGAQPRDRVTRTAASLSILSPERLARILARMLDEAEFLSAHGVRGLSKCHADHPFELQLDGMTARVDYEPGESTSALFGGNSNWRGPVWFPINHLIVGSLMRFHSFLGPSFTVEFPTGSGRQRDTRRGRRRAGPAAGRAVPARARREAPGARRVRPVPHRPRLARPDPVPRVLPRRDRRGARCLPSDGVDGVDPRPGAGPAVLAPTVGRRVGHSSPGRRPRARRRAPLRPSAALTAPDPGPTASDAALAAPDSALTAPDPGPKSPSWRENRARWRERRAGGPAAATD